MTESELRQAARRAYGFACGYCGVREEDVGSLLELDHFKPRAAGGNDEIENLIYCCTTCNRLKGDFWPASATEKRLLHPKHDNLSQHLHLEPDGLLTALTETGGFHLSRLRLNRPPLVALWSSESEERSSARRIRTGARREKIIVRAPRRVGRRNRKSA